MSNDPIEAAHELIAKAIRRAAERGYEATNADELERGIQRTLSEYGVRSHGHTICPECGDSIADADFHPQWCRGAASAENQ